MSTIPAENIMSRHPITCSQDDTTSTAARRMWEHDVGVLPVVDMAGCVVGMITDRDIAMAAYIQGVPLERIGVESAMSHRVVSVHPQASVTEVEKLMQQHQVRRIAVVDEGGRPVGLVSLNDLARRSGPARSAPVSQEELTQTLRAVCQPRATALQAHAMTQ